MRCGWCFVACGDGRAEAVRNPAPAMRHAATVTPIHRSNRPRLAASRCMGKLRLHTGDGCETFADSQCHVAVRPKQKRLLAVWRSIWFASALAACAPQAASRGPGYAVLNGAAQVRRYAALQAALSQNVSGTPRLWSGPGHTHGGITPLETVQSKYYGWCRSYEELTADRHRRQTDIGIACRTPDGGWVVLDLRRMAVISVP